MSAKFLLSVYTLWLEVQLRCMRKVIAGLWLNIVQSDYNMKTEVKYIFVLNVVSVSFRSVVCAFSLRTLFYNFSILYSL